MFSSSCHLLPSWVSAHQGEVALLTRRAPLETCGRGGLEVRGHNDCADKRTYTAHTPMHDVNSCASMDRDWHKTQEASETRSRSVSLTQTHEQVTHFKGRKPSKDLSLQVVQLDPARAHHIKRDTSSFRHSAKWGHFLRLQLHRHTHHLAHRTTPHWGLT